MAKGRQEAIEELKPSLTQAIQAWSDSVAEGDAWDALEMYVSEDFAKLMSDAAIAVLAGMSDVQRYLRDNLGWEG